MGQTSRCCMVCLMPQSHVSCSLENPHFSIFTLDRPTCERNRLRAFQVVQGFSAPAGRCSSGLMLRCTLASRGSSRSLHSSMRAAFAVVLMDSVHLMKLFRDFRRGTTPRCPLSGCLWSVVCRVRSVRLATALLMSDGAIPARMGRLLVFVGFRQPVIIRQVSFSVASSFFAWVERWGGVTTKKYPLYAALFGDPSQALFPRWNRISWRTLVDHAANKCYAADSHIIIIVLKNINPGFIKCTII